jgi:regulation of enolase protein 1 (concanavalin A-like superfamily)
MRVHVPAKVDYFQDPGGELFRYDSAPFLWLPVTGDFVARLRVRPDFRSTYDSGCLMVRQDAQHWAKLCFEQTDFGTRAVVSVVTDGVSDDANGVDVSVDEIWLQMVRVGGCFGLHYSLDGANWRMVRYFGLSVPAEAKVGMVAQCPTGPGTVVDLLEFSLEQRTVESIRAGV